MRVLRQVSDARKGPPFDRRHIALAVSLVVFFFTALSVWGAYAPIGGAIIASGVVGVETNRKAVQHPDGGIIKRIAVKEGSKVKAGDLLIELVDIAATSSVERTAVQYFEALAASARLIAERDGDQTLTFPTALLQAGAFQKYATAAMNAQRKIFESRRTLHRQKKSVLEKRIERLTEESLGLDGMVAALNQQIALVESTRRDAAALFEKQLIRKSRLLEIERQKAELMGKLSRARSEIAQNKQQRSELELQVTQLGAAVQAEVAEDLRQQQAKALDLAPALAAVEDVQTRTRIRAPFGGTVVGLQVHSRETVIAKGQLLMEIVPDSDSLIVDAHIRPEEISEVHAGLPARVVLRTPSRRYNQPVIGSVESISADRLLDKVTSRPYYLARIKVASNDIASADARMIAGMSADVFIQLGDRTVFEYLAAPLLRSFHRGMRER